MSIVLSSYPLSQAEREGIEREIENVKSALVSVMGEKYSGQICSSIDWARVVFYDDNTLFEGAFDDTELNRQLLNDKNISPDDLVAAILFSARNDAFHANAYNSKSGDFFPYIVFPRNATSIMRVHEFTHAACSKLVRDGRGFACKHGLCVDTGGGVMLEELFTQYLAKKAWTRMRRLGQVKDAYDKSGVEPFLPLVENLFNDNFDAFVEAYMSDDLDAINERFGEQNVGKLFKNLDALWKVSGLSGERGELIKAFASAHGENLDKVWRDYVLKAGKTRKQIDELAKVFDALSFANDAIKDCEKTAQDLREKQ